MKKVSDRETVSRVQAGPSLTLALTRVVNGRAKVRPAAADGEATKKGKMRVRSLLRARYLDDLGTASGRSAVGARCFRVRTEESSLGRRDAIRSSWSICPTLARSRRRSRDVRASWAGYGNSDLGSQRGGQRREKGGASARARDEGGGRMERLARLSHREASTVPFRPSQPSRSLFDRRGGPY